MMAKEPTYDELVDFARWAQGLQAEKAAIMLREGIVIGNLNNPIEKLAFTLYTDLCEIHSRVSNLFDEDWLERDRADRIR